MFCDQFLFDVGNYIVFRLFRSVRRGGLGDLNTLRRFSHINCFLASQVLWMSWLRRLLDSRCQRLTMRMANDEIRFDCYGLATPCINRRREVRFAACSDGLPVAFQTHWLSLSAYTERNNIQ